MVTVKNFPLTNRRAQQLIVEINRVFPQFKPMLAQFAQLAKLAQLVQLARLAQFDKLILNYR